MTAKIDGWFHDLAGILEPISPQAAAGSNKQPGRKPVTTLPTLTLSPRLAGTGIALQTQGWQGRQRMRSFSGKNVE